jgi:hypothetical protein
MEEARYANHQEEAVATHLQPTPRQTEASLMLYLTQHQWPTLTSKASKPDKLPTKTSEYLCVSVIIQALSCSNYVFFRLAGNKLSDSNIPTRARILCAGSGAVAWGREIAMNDPLSEVVVLTTEPYSTYLPKNCTVEEGNIVEYDQDGWDHVFIRNNRAVAHWGRYLIHLNNITRPGGRIELVDIDDKKGAVCTCAKHPSQWARAKRNRCRTCLEFPSVKARKDTLKASGFSELNIVYHGRMRRTRDGTMVYSASIISTACSNAQQQTESQSKSQTHCHG